MNQVMERRANSSSTAARVVRGIEGMSVEEVNAEIEKGARFVVFYWVISPFLMSFKRTSPIYFVRADEGTFRKSAQYTFRSLLLGWWGIPYGFYWTPSALYSNTCGGVDVTAYVVRMLNSQRLPQRLNEHAFDNWGTDPLPFELLDRGVENWNSRRARKQAA